MHGIPVLCPELVTNAPVDVNAEPFSLASACSYKIGTAAFRYNLFVWIPYASTSTWSMSVSVLDHHFEVVNIHMNNGQFVPESWYKWPCPFSCCFFSSSACLSSIGLSFLYDPARVLEREAWKRGPSSKINDLLLPTSLAKGSFLMINTGADIEQTDARRGGEWCLIKPQRPTVVLYFRPAKNREIPYK